MAESPLTSLTPAAKRRATITPLASTSPGITRAPDAASHDGAILINRDVVPPHYSHCTFLILAVYKRLLPDDIVRLQAGVEIIDVRSNYLHMSLWYVVHAPMLLFWLDFAAWMTS